MGEPHCVLVVGLWNSIYLEYKYVPHKPSTDNLYTGSTVMAKAITRTTQPIN